LMAKGLTNNQIAATLNLGETAIKTHVSAVLKSLLSLYMWIIEPRRLLSHGERGSLDATE